MRGARLHLFIGTWPQAPEVRTPRESGGGGLPWRSRSLAVGWAPLGPRRASGGLRAGPAGRGRPYGLGPMQKDKICFVFFEIFSSAKTNSEIPENAYKARKILRKSQKLQKNSQRHIGT
jgi:hypothetical protein